MSVRLWIAAAAAVALAISGTLLVLWLTGDPELVTRDWPFPEAARHPNRMAPNAALSFVVLGAVLLLAPARARLAATGQILALVLIAIDGVALIGYLYDASFLYRSGAFIRISPYTALCF